MMAAKIVEVKREHFPKARFIGKRYTDADRVNGMFGAKWGKWWANDWFTPLEEMGVLPLNDGCMAAMRVVDGVFEYWIGYFFAEGTAAPEGYEFVDTEPVDFAKFWIYGNENNGELYGMDVHNMCLEEIKKRGWERFEDNWCFERYNCPRFTTPDENGNVILDYGISIY